MTVRRAARLFWVPVIGLVASACTGHGSSAPTSAPTSPAPTTSLPVTASSTPATGTATSSVPAAATSSPVPSRSVTGYAAADPARIVHDMTAAAHAASSVRVSGSLDQGGSTVVLDVTYAGADAQGSANFAKSSLELVRAGGALYIRAPRAVWLAQGVKEAALPRVVGKWVRLPSADAERFRILTDLQYLLANFERTAYVVDGARTVNGVDAVALRDSAGTVLTVEAAAPHVPLTITGGAGDGSLTFTRWNRPVSITAPVGAVNLSSVG
jgi:hypothetical protein